MPRAFGSGMTIDPSQLETVAGGYKVIERKATPEELAQFDRCAADAQGISKWKPWTWGRKNVAQCFGGLLKGMQSNPGIERDLPLPGQRDV